MRLKLMGFHRELGHDPIQQPNIYFQYWAKISYSIHPKYMGLIGGLEKEN